VEDVACPPGRVGDRPHRSLPAVISVLKDALSVPILTASDPLPYHLSRKCVTLYPLNTDHLLGVPYLPYVRTPQRIKGEVVTTLKSERRLWKMGERDVECVS
jgi:hypothetical protein